MHSRNVGVYGGRFDPIHLGHLICAESVRDAFDLDRVLMVTSATPPHRSEDTPAEVRHRMVQAACAGNPGLEACDVELRRQGPSRTYDTLCELSQPETQLWFLSSSEYLDPQHPWHFPRWHRGAELLAEFPLALFLRPGHTLEQARQWAEELGCRYRLLEHCPTPPLSSTWIRQQVSRGRSIRYLVEPAVEELIRQEHLYGYCSV